MWRACLVSYDTSTVCSLGILIHSVQYEAHSVDQVDLRHSACGFHLILNRTPRLFSIGGTFDHFIL